MSDVTDPQKPLLPVLPTQEISNPAADHLHMNKGEEVDLTKLAGRLQKLTVGLGWDAPEQSDGLDVDIDACAFLLKENGRVRRDTDFVFYNNLKTEKCLEHGGDSTTGVGDGDDEVIHVYLDNVPFDVDRIAFTVTIHNAHDRQQTFGLVSNAYIRIVNEADGAELAHYDLTEDASENNAMIFGYLVRDLDSWKFRAVGQGTSGGLFELARDFGVNVAPN